MSFVDNIITWYSAHMNYASITALMAVESSFIPFPSEVVIPPAAFVAGQPESVLCATGNYPVDVLLIVLFGTLGCHDRRHHQLRSVRVARTYYHL